MWISKAVRASVARDLIPRIEDDDWFSSIPNS